MSIITDEMDRLKGVALGKFMGISCGAMPSAKTYFELGYAYGMDDARKIQETIKVLAEEAVNG